MQTYGGSTKKLYRLNNNKDGSTAMLLPCFYGSKAFLLLLLLFILTANGFSPGGSGTTIIHNTQHTSHKIRQRSNETQHTKLHTQ
jgi:hypothetical protein